MKHTMSPLSLPPPATVENNMSPRSLPLREPSKLSISSDGSPILMLYAHAIQQANDILIRQLRNENMQIDVQLMNQEYFLRTDSNDEEDFLDSTSVPRTDSNDEEDFLDSTSVPRTDSNDEEDFLDSTSVPRIDSNDEEDFLDSTSVISPISSPLEIEIPSQSNSPELGMILHNLRGDSPCSSVDIPSFFLDSSNEDRFSDSRDGFDGFSESNDGDGNFPVLTNENFNDTHPRTIYYGASGR